MPKGPSGQKRPADAISRAVQVMRIATGEVEDKTSKPGRAKGGKAGGKKRALIGKPAKRNVSTSYVEKHNQTMRQSMKRFARLTAGHSKKIDNHVAMVALYTTFYNFARINSAVRMSPAMACGLEQRLWDIGDIVKLVGEWEAAE